MRSWRLSNKTDRIPADTSPSHSCFSGSLTRAGGACFVATPTYRSAVHCFDSNSATQNNRTLKQTMSDAEAATSSTETTTETVENVEKMDEINEPEAKRRKLIKNSDLDDKKNRLEERLGSILCCAVCLDLPRAAVYQVSHRFIYLFL